MHTSLKKRLLNLATAPYRAVGHVHYHWARGKLGHDPFFAVLADAQIIPDHAHVIDIGCGRGLLAAWLLAAETLYRDRAWSTESAPQTAPPVGLSFYGVDLVQREVDCGNSALRPLFGERVQLALGDMRTVSLEGASVVAILDVLHYVPYADQDQLLDRIRAALPAGGVLITRVGNAGSGWRFRFSQFVDRCMALKQGHRLPRMWCRPVSEWVSALESRGFVVSTRPMSQGTPFANVMIAAHLSIAHAVADSPLTDTP
jgi:SAM-dependent methyltransferase